MKMHAGYPTTAKLCTFMSVFPGAAAETSYARENIIFTDVQYTPGCTAEACAFRDSYEVFKDAGAEVLGVSSDSVAAHQKFVTKYRLPFILLSDKDGMVRKRYGAVSAFGLIPGRVTYIIDKEGIVRHVFSSQLAAERHIDEALKTLNSAH